MALDHIVALDFEENVGLKSTALTSKFLLYCKLQKRLFYHFAGGRWGYTVTFTRRQSSSSLGRFLVHWA